MISTSQFTTQRNLRTKMVHLGGDGFLYSCPLMDPLGSRSNTEAVSTHTVELYSTFSNPSLAAECGGANNDKGYRAS